MPILLLLRLILETSVTDIQTAEMLEKFKKNSDLFAKFMRNPAVFLKSRAMAKVLGKGKKQDELNAFQESWKSLANLPVIKKKIMNHVRIKNFAKIQQIQKYYLKGQKLMQSDQEIETDNISDDQMIGVHINLTSLALSGGMWVPIVQLKKDTYGIATVEFKHSAKQYDFFNIPLSVWKEMVETTSVDGSGAWSILGDYYYGGLEKANKTHKQERTRGSVSLLHKRVTKPSSTSFVVNKGKAMEGYKSYKNYGKRK